MIISQKAVDAIKTNTRLKNKLAVELDLASTTIVRWIRIKDMLSLTGAAAMHIDLIKEESGLTESEILVSEAEVVQN